MTLLKVKSVQFNVKITDDSGSRAHTDISTWKPKLDSGWSYLGPAANNGDSRGCPGIVVKPAGSARVLAPITDWELIWNDSGSGNRNDYALWQAVPSLEDRINFVSLAGFFIRSHNKPSVDEAKGMMAVHKDVLVTVRAGRQIWSDAGTRARMAGSVWEASTDGHLQAIATGAFVPTRGYNAPRNTYALDRSRNSLSLGELSEGED